MDAVEMLVDERGDLLRATWRDGDTAVELSLWRDDRCRATFQLNRDDAARLTRLLVIALADGAMTPPAA